MSNSALHSTRFSGAVYSASKGSYIGRRVRISIHIVSIVVALKVLVDTLPYMFTCMAGLIRVAKINNSTVSFSRTFGRVCLCLNRTPNLLQMVTVSVNPICRTLNTISGYHYIRDSYIAPYKIISGFRFFWGNFYGLLKERYSFFINQVRFSLDKRKMFRLVAHKINFLFTSKLPRTNHIVWLVGHNSSIISDRALIFKVNFIMQCSKNYYLIIC